MAERGVPFRGVLFAGLILVFMGEMSAALLERATGIPF